MSPLNSIITDQVCVLKKWGIRANVLTEKKAQTCSFPQLYGNHTFTLDVAEEETEQLLHLPNSVRNGEAHIVFCHPEAILGTEGRMLLKTPAYQKQVVACVIDEAHCVEMWYVYIYIYYLYYIILYYIIYIIIKGNCSVLLVLQWRFKSRFESGVEQNQITHSCLKDNEVDLSKYIYIYINYISNHILWKVGNLFNSHA